MGEIVLLFLVLCPMVGGPLAIWAGRGDEARRDAIVWIVGLIELLLTLPCVGIQGASLRFEGVCGLGLGFTLDGLRVVYAVIIAGMWEAALVFSCEYMAHHHERDRYYVSMLFTEGAIMGVFLSADLFTTFVFFEMMSVSSYALVAHDETRPALRAAQTYLAIAIIGGLVTLTGLLMLHQLLGTLDIARLREAADMTGDRARLWIAGALTFVGFAAKAAAFPLHVWLPTAHTAAPAPASALLSGLLTKSGLFGVLVLSVGPFHGDAAWGMMLLCLALAGMVLGALLAVLSVDLKRTLACSSMSQLGFIMTGAALWCLDGHDGLASRGTVLYMVGHSLVKLVLFLAAGVVHMNAHKLALGDVRGFGRGKPLFAFASAMGGLGLMGMPLWNGYLGKTLVHEAIVERLHHIAHTGAGVLPFMSATGEATFFWCVEWAFLISGALTTAYVLKLWAVLFLSSPAPDLHSNDPYMRPMSALVLCVSSAILPLLGCLPDVLGGPISVAGASFLHTGPAAHHHAVHWTSLEALEGAGISIGMGTCVFLFLVRPFLMRSDGHGGLLCRDLWPTQLDLERLVFRPAIELASSVGGALASCVDRTADACLRALPSIGTRFASIIDAVVETALRVLPFVATLLARVLDALCDALPSIGLAWADRVRFVRQAEAPDFGVYSPAPAPSFRTLLSSTLACGLLALALGLIAVLVWAVM
ncbi:MAG: hypothetical protein IJR14_07785 [Synergistaceae bacterium]|nr:hypothetical protein [Synergistaceae bacterium]